MIRLSAFAFVAALAASSVAAQTAAQCEQALYVGPDQANPAVMAACTSYFQSLATNAAAPGTFGSAVTTVPIVSTQGSGG